MQFIYRIYNYGFDYHYQSCIDKIVDSLKKDQIKLYFLKCIAHVQKFSN